MKKHPAPRRRIELGFSAALALVLAAFEWAAYQYDTAQYSAYTGGLTLEAEVVPPNAPSRPAPPVRNLPITPEIHPDPPVGPEPSPDPAIDPLAGKIQDFDFGDFGDSEYGDWEVETVLVAEHMPHFTECYIVLDRDAEHACTEGQIIRMIQACTKFPPSCAKRESAAWFTSNSTSMNTGTFRTKPSSNPPIPNSTRRHLRRSGASLDWSQEHNRAGLFG
jgi:hypothetical protein